MRTQQYQPRLAREVIEKFSAVQLGQKSPHLERPFADIFSVALKQVFIINMNIKEEHYPRWFKIHNAFIDLTELDAVGKIGEQSRLDLAIASSLKKEDYKDRRPLFEL